MTSTPCDPSPKPLQALCTKQSVILGSARRFVEKCPLIIPVSRVLRASDEANDVVENPNNGNESFAGVARKYRISSDGEGMRGQEDILSHYACSALIRPHFTVALLPQPAFVTQLLSALSKIVLDSTPLYTYVQMAPVKSVKKTGSEERVEAALDLAKRGITYLRDREQPPSSFDKDIRSQIEKSISLSINNSNAQKIAEVDALGCDLWNATTNFLREDLLSQEDVRGQNSEATKVICTLRIFAFLLIDAAHFGLAKRSYDPVRVTRDVKIGLKACRYCLGQMELDLASKALERCANYTHDMESRSPSLRIKDAEGQEMCRESEISSCVSQFHLLRMMHALKSDRLDLAEHFYDKYLASSGRAIATVTEICAQFCLDGGKALKKQGSIEMATKWLNRALIALNEVDIECLSQDAVGLRIAISSCLVETLLEVGNVDVLARAHQLVQDLESKHGLSNRMAIHLLHLKVLLVEKPLDSHAVSEVMTRAFRVPILTDQTFKVIMQAIRKVHKQSSNCAFDALEHYIVKRLIPEVVDRSEQHSSTQDWIERTYVALVLYATEKPTSIDLKVTGRLKDIIHSVYQGAKITFTPRATHAAQALIWKATNAASPDVADALCTLVRHPIFDNAGSANKAKIGRKVVTIALEKGDLEAAREAFFQMPVVVQNESISRYLAFKIAIRMDDYDLALQCLQVVLKHADRDTTFLYACALEAQRSRSRNLAVAALQAILDKQPSRVHIPSLLRCIARLVIGELDSPSCHHENVAIELVRIFETATTNLPIHRRSSSDQWSAEIQWWTKNAYNLALKLCTQVDPRLLVRLLRACIRFIELNSGDAGSMRDEDLQRKQSLCLFLSAGALIAIARSEDAGAGTELQCYVEARETIADFRSVQGGRMSDVDSNRRSFELQKLDLECILHLSQWDELKSAFENCLSFDHVDKWDALADIVLIIHQQAGSSGLDSDTSALMMELLDRIINETWQKHKDIVKASRWLRLSFSLDLQDGNGNFALKLLAQAAGMARKQMERQREQFPETELQWLATTSFNRAVDLFSEGRHEACMEWIESALELARYAADNGALHANLTYKKGLVEERMTDGRM